MTTAGESAFPRIMGSMERLRAELVALAESGEGVILTEDLRRHGFDAAELASAVRLLHPLRRGAYSMVEPTNAASRHKLVLRAVLRLRGDRAIASHASAALLYGLPVPEASLDTVHMQCGTLPLASACGTECTSIQPRTRGRRFRSRRFPPPMLRPPCSTAPGHCRLWMQWRCSTQR